MLIQQITEGISRIPAGGVVDSTDRWDQGYLDFLAITYRAKIIQLVYQRDKRLNPICYQKNWPVFEPLLQDNPCCVKFRHPEVLVLDSFSDGFRYVGTLNYAKSFPRVQSRAWLSTFNMNAVTAINNSRPAYLYDGSSKILEIYGMAQFQTPLTEILAMNPLDVATFNRAQDEFPLPDNLISDLIQMIYQDTVSIEDKKQLRPQDQVINVRQPKRQKS